MKTTSKVRGGFLLVTLATPLVVACGDDGETSTSESGGADTDADSSAGGSTGVDPTAGEATGDPSGGSSTGSDSGPGSTAASSGGDGSGTGTESSAGSSGTGSGGDTTGAGTTGGGSTGGGTTGGAGESTGTGTTGGLQCDQTLYATVRDFQMAHPDMEGNIADDRGLVETMLGADGKPVYAQVGPTATTTSAETFDQWYRDVPGVNISIPIELELVESSPGVWTFDDGEFFPIDGQGFGNEGNPRNYHFTLEINTEFPYFGGEVFTFRGDDDLFVFINGVLAMDLGGVHLPQAATVDLDARAAEFGITPGDFYTLDFFFAERHMDMSNFRIDTTIGCFEPPIG